jgi:hypothetical protein
MVRIPAFAGMTMNYPAASGRGIKDLYKEFPFVAS